MLTLYHQAFLEMNLTTEVQQPERAQVEWTLNGTPVIANEQRSFHRDGSNYALLIKAVGEEDSGQYVCTVTTLQGTESKGCLVEIEAESVF